MLRADVSCWSRASTGCALFTSKLSSPDQYFTYKCACRSCGHDTRTYKAPSSAHTSVRSGMPLKSVPCTSANVYRLKAMSAVATRAVSGAKEPEADTKGHGK